MSHENYPLTESELKYLETPRSDGRSRIPTDEDRKYMKKGWFLYRPLFPENDSSRDTRELVYDNYLDFFEDILQKKKSRAEDGSIYPHAQSYLNRRPGKTDCVPIDQYFRRKNSLTQPPMPKPSKK